MTTSAKLGAILMSWIQRNMTLFLVVVVPTTIAVVYFGLIASDVYISESEFVVRTHTPSSQSEGIVGSLLRNTGLGYQDDNSALVRDYVLSRDAARELDHTLGIRSRYSSHRVSIFDRFPGLSWNRSFEKFFVYYRRHVAVGVDPASAILNLEVRAYSAEDARAINEALLAMAEKMVNALNMRSHQDIVSYAERDVDAAAGKAAAATLALAEYRSKNAVFEANKQADIKLKEIANLQEQLVAVETQLVELGRLAPQSPQILALHDRATALKGAIAAETAKVTGSPKSLTAHAATLDRLLVDLDVADKLLGAAVASLATARSQALNKEVYLERLVEPALPDYAVEPRRIRSVVTVLLVSLLAWGVASLVLASIREHAE
jgi:capsular polysaccharide transport system permease protein